MDYEWISENTILVHIKKHILNHRNNNEIEEIKWKKEFNYLNYDLLKYKNDNEIKSHPLFKSYVMKSNEIVKENNFKYIFKTDNTYSCNYKREDGLTTCLQLKYKYYEHNINITSCFFRTSAVIDSSILYAAKYLLNNPIESCNYKIKGLILCNNNFEKALNKMNYSLTNTIYQNSKIKIAMTLISGYLELQYDYYKNNTIDCEYFKYLIDKFRDDKYSYEKEKNKILKDIEIKKDYIKNMTKDLYLDDEISNCEITFLTLCELSIKFFYDEEKYIKEFEKILNYF